MRDKICQGKSIHQVSDLVVSLLMEGHQLHNVQTGQKQVARSKSRLLLLMN